MNIFDQTTKTIMTPREAVQAVCATLHHNIVAADDENSCYTIQVRGSITMHYVIEFDVHGVPEVRARDFDFWLKPTREQMRSVAALARFITFRFMKTFTPFEVSRYMRSNGMNIK